MNSIVLTLFQLFEALRSPLIRSCVHLFVCDLESRTDAPVCRETSTGTERNERAGGTGHGRTQECKASKSKDPGIQTTDRYIYCQKKMRADAKYPQTTSSLF